jgi:hypothetical protein
VRCLLIALLMSIAALSSGTSVAQAPYAPERTADGRPDFTGVWTNADVDVTLQQTVDGKVLATPLNNPADQHLPFRDRASAMAWREKYAAYMTGKPLPEFTQGVDTLPYRDRCLMAANAAAPPMTSQGYNDAYQIVQTPSVIVISVEMMDETRIVPMFAGADEARKAHGPPVLQRWTGDSVGWWEGDTLVIETISVRVQQGQQSPFPTSPDARVTERLTLTSDDQLLYSAEITDPAIYTRPWTLAYTFRPARRLWEYACHEGNYGMANILSGVRKTERDRADGAKLPD